MTNMYRDLTNEQLIFLGRMVADRVNWYDKNKPDARFAECARYILKELREEYDNRFPSQDWESSVKIDK